MHAVHAWSVFKTLFYLIAGVHSWISTHSFHKDASLMLALSIKPHWSPHTLTSRFTEITLLKLAHAHFASQEIVYKRLQV